MSNTSIVVLAVFVAGYLLSSYLWEKHSKRSKEARYQRGYNYAASGLLNKEFTCDSLLQHANNAFDQNEFDIGIKQAVIDYTMLVRNSDG